MLATALVVGGLLGPSAHLLFMAVSAHHAPPASIVAVPAHDPQATMHGGHHDVAIGTADAVLEGPTADPVGACEYVALFATTFIGEPPAASWEPEGLVASAGSEYDDPLAVSIAARAVGGRGPPASVSQADRCASERISMRVLAL